MKSNLLFLLFCLTASIASAQFTFLDIDNNPVESGATVTFGQGQVGDPDGFYSYFVANDASEAIFMKAELFSAENTDGSFFEICFSIKPTLFTDFNTLEVLLEKILTTT